MDLLAKILPGASGMANIHPLLVHFPIALLSSFFIMELLGAVLKRDPLRTAATWMLYLGTLGAMVAAAAGVRAFLTVDHPEEAHPIMVAHGAMMGTVTLMAVALSVWRLATGGDLSPRARALHILAGFVMVALMTFAADLGGLMVYKYGVGVKAVSMPPMEAGPEAEPHTHSHTH